MRSFCTLGALALAALSTLIAAGPAAAASKAKAPAFAAKYHLSGAWKNKDADKDGLKNFKEFKLGTNPKSPDTDRDGLKDADEVRSANDPTDRDTDGDGIKDGAEHAGTVIAFDGETITLREFATGKAVTATLDTGCTSADDSSVDDEDVDVPEDEVSADDSTADDDGVEEEEVELDDDSSCDDDALKQGVVLTSAEFEKDGANVLLVGYELA
jgi:hypothetical protein